MRASVRSNFLSPVFVLPIKLAFLLTVALWAALICAPIHAQVTMAHLASRDLGWAVDGSHVFVTTNEGSTWSDVTPPYGNTELLSDVTFVDQKIGVRYAGFRSAGE